MVLFSVIYPNLYTGGTVIMLTTAELRSADNPDNLFVVSSF